MAETSYAIVVENLVKRYKKAETNAVDGVSFSVRPGEFFAFLGPNGAGKTTTISILTTTLEKTSGRVEIAGHDLEREAKAVRQNSGIIFQKPSLDKNLTAEENVRFHTCLYGLYPYRPTYGLMPKEYKVRVQELAEVLDLEKDMFKPIRTLSGGMKRKLEIIRSLMHHPRVLFLDEPTSGLDPLSRKNLWQYLNNVREQEDTTVFLTTHYLDEAEGAGRVCIINQGKIISEGTPAQLKRRLIEEYLLVDAKNRSALRRELTKIGAKYEEKEEFRVYFDGMTPQQLIKKIDTPLTRLEIVMPSLEEAYVNLVEES